jgi:hypothetical protein
MCRSPHIISMLGRFLLSVEFYELIDFAGGLLNVTSRSHMTCDLQGSRILSSYNLFFLTCAVIMATRALWAGGNNRNKMSLGDSRSIITPLK